MKSAFHQLVVTMHATMHPQISFLGKKFAEFSKCLAFHVDANETSNYFQLVPGGGVTWNLGVAAVHVVWGRLIEWMSECWMNEWLSEWVSEWMKEWMSEWMKEWMNEWMNEWMSEWMSEVSAAIESQSA